MFKFCWTQVISAARHFSFPTHPPEYADETTP